MRYTLQEIKNGTGFPTGQLFDTAETYEGWTNRETWAFWLWISNDEGWYELVRECVTEYQLEPNTADDLTDYQVGERVVSYVKDTLDEVQDANECAADPINTTAIRMMRDDIGSWWRIDYAEIGAHARELVAEEVTA